MLLHEFKCGACNLRFESWVDSGKASEGANCPSCKNTAPKFFGKMNFSFSGGKPTEGNIDMIVGRKAEERWNNFNASFEKRQKVRKESKENFVVEQGPDMYRAGTAPEKESTRQALNSYEKSVKDNQGVK